MNEFLSLKPGVRILAGTSPANVKTQFAGWFADAGWQVLSSSTATVLDVIPPTSQQIGNSLGADVLRIQFNPGDITLRTAILIRTPQYRRWYISSSSTASTSASLKIGAQTISVSGAATGGDSLTQKLHQALSASTATEALAYGYELVTGSGGNDDYIIATEKAAGQGQTISNVSNANVYSWGDSQSVGAVVDRGAYLSNNRYKFTVNYGVDWVCFLSLTTRSAVIAIRTAAAGFLGPLGASWMRQDDAAGQCPEGCAPVQLLLADLGTASAVQAVANFGHLYGYGGTTDASRVAAVAGYTGALSASIPFPPVPEARNYIPFGGVEPVTWGYPGGLSATNPPVTQVVGAAASTALAGLVVPGRVITNNTPPLQGWTPAAVLPDLCCFFAAGDNETTLATRNMQARTRLSAAADSSTTTLTLTDASMLAPTGTVIIGSEIINYSSKDGNTLLGCERGKASTQAAPHGTSEDVFRAFWWIRVNYGALPAGPVDPATTG